MDDILLDDVLYHAGVKGMKWGVRKQRPTGGGIRARVGSALANQHERGQNKKVQANLKRINRAEKNIASSHNSSRYAMSKTIGKAFVLSSVTAYGSAALSSTIKNPKTRLGVDVIGHTLSATIGIRGVMDTMDIHAVGKHKGI